jgi:hypothetical protein
MGKYRPRGSKSKRVIGKAVGYGLNEYHKNMKYDNKNNNNPDNGASCLFVLIIFIIILFLLCK